MHGPRWISTSSCTCFTPTTCMWQMAFNHAWARGHNSGGIVGLTRNLQMGDFWTLAAIFDIKIISRRPGRYLKTFPEPMASLSINMSPWRAMGTSFIPKLTNCLCSWQARHCSSPPQSPPPISTTTVLRFCGTHLDLFPTPCYIDIFQKGHHIN